jgi:ABC-type sugar transport system permease subunit
MFSSHGQDYFFDSIAFLISLIPFGLVAALIVASLVQEPLKARAAVRTDSRRDPRL